MAGICLVLTAPTLDKNFEHVCEYRTHLDYVELRVDLLDRSELGSVSSFPVRCDVPVICTLRRRRDGGQFDGDESERYRFFESIVDAGFSFVDLELDFRVADPKRADEVSRVLSDRGVRIIRSQHDFKGVPDDLDALYADLSAVPSEIPKIAVYPKSFADAFRLYVAAAGWVERDKIVLGMGTFGFFTRILAGKMGSMFTFTSPKGVAAAPGHVDPDTLCDVYRYRSIGPSTRILAVIADPVMHSRSPWIHNPAIEALDLDAVYVPIHVDNPVDFFQAWDRLDIDGISVTIPHKERVIPLLSSVDGAVEHVGSCNTVVRAPDGGFLGSNTDVPGFLAAIRNLLPGDGVPQKALVVGAGGTSRAIVYALTSAGTRVMIVNRTADKAKALAKEYGCEWGVLSIESEKKMRGYSDLIVQTTSAGMTPNTDDPLDFYRLSGSEALFDVVYAPPMTPLLLRAAEAGCRVTNGWSMLLEQAYLQFYAFTGVEYPSEIIIPEPT